ncbi:hypothetical protein Y1Q_0000162 [Alligator mississippiensis]|uniref:Endonuclease/exonuclease/phosphatase domain-containing protein n=1 Tax=Alligator mississippiensis TaxID=8496 RepID=A0A151MY85_ALLMI|nr:hypothetical protein Y1Q_0000162 [Alligator mississippiensis]
MTCLPKGVNGQVMVFKFPLLGKKCAIIISGYASTMTDSDKVKNQFYDDLHSVILAVPKSGHLILFGYFNARIGSDCQAWDGIIERHRIKSSNRHGLLLLKLCAKHKLLVTNTVFHLLNQKKTLYTYPCSKHWHLTDYVIIIGTDAMSM